MKDKKFSEKLFELRNKLALTQPEMAPLLGIQLRMYQKYENGDSEPQGITLAKFNNKLDELQKGLPVKQDVGLTKQEKPIPFYDVDVSAGAVGMFDDQGEQPAFFNSIPGFEDCNFAIRVFGHSMYPTYPTGVYILCKEIKNYDIIPYGECFLVVTEEFRMVKRLLKSKYKGFVLATSDNEEIKNGKRVYDDFEVDTRKMRGLYLVKGQLRKEQI